MHNISEHLTVHWTKPLPRSEAQAGHMEIVLAIKFIYKAEV